jgi:hypothetical protein
MIPISGRRYGNQYSQYHELHVASSPGFRLKKTMAEITTTAIKMLKKHLLIIPTVEPSHY